MATGAAIAAGQLSWGTGGDGLAVFIVGAANGLFLSGTLAVTIAVLLNVLEQAGESLTREMEERRRAEAERARLGQHLRQTQKLEAIGTLAGGIAHDVNNLLMPIFSYTEELLDSTPAGSRQWQRIHVIHRAAERARDLVRRILAFSRPTPAMPRGPVSVCDIVRETGRLLRVSVPQNVRVEWECEDEDAVVVADASEVHQMLMNLETNAYHAMREEGGILTIRVARGGTDTVRLRVPDTGVGMDAYTRERAFDPFFTTRAPGEGTGLGLATVHRIASSLGGRVYLDSRPGAGTSVEVLLPAAPAYVAAGSERRSVATAALAALRGEG